MLFIGICGISYEYTFSKLASDIMGDSVKQWSIIIGLMMLFMGVGADLQKYLPDKMLVDNFIILEILLGLFGAAGPTVILWSFSEFADHFILIHYFFICLVGLFIGLEIPLLTRVNQLMAKSLKDNLGMILKMDYIGSFLGALIWLYILPKFFNLLEISYFLGLVNIVIGLFSWFWFKRWMHYPKLVPILGLICLIIVGVGIMNGQKITITLEQKLYKDPIVYTKTTTYQHLVVTRKKSGEFYFYINGNLQFSSFDEHIYHEFLVHPVMSASRTKKRVLILGGGDGLAVREVLKYPQVQDITLVDLDPEVTKLARTSAIFRKLNQDSLLNKKIKSIKAKGVTEGEKVRLNQSGQGFFRSRKKDDSVRISVLNLDAYQFLETAQGIYDIIIIDFPDPNNLMLSKLYSLEFYQLLKGKLAYDGMLVQQSSSPVFAKEAFLMIGRTMKKAGLDAVPIHHVVPSFGDWGWWIGGHQERSAIIPIKTSLKRIDKLPKTVNYITVELVKSSLEFGKGALKSKQTGINKILDDKIFQTYINAWKKVQ